MVNETHYQKVRSIARQLGRRESLYVVWAYSQYLQLNDFQIPADIQVLNQFQNPNTRRTILAEWTMEQITREIICHADEEPRRGRSLRQWDTLAEIANALRDLEGVIYSELVGSERIHLELMRIAHRQFVWQQHRFNWKPFIRYFRLFNTPAIVAYVQQATGLTLNEIYLVGLCYIGHFRDHPRASRTVNVRFSGLGQEHFDRFLAFTCLSNRELSRRLRAEHGVDEGSPSPSIIGR